MKNNLNLTMKTTGLIMLMTLTLVLDGQAQKSKNVDKGYIIKGNVKGLNQKKIKLVNWENGKVIGDSVDIRKGRFEFKGAVEYPRTMVLQTADLKLSRIIYVENTLMTVTGDMKDPKAVKVSGSKTNDEYVAYTALIAEDQDRLSTEYRKVMELKKTYPDSATKMGELIVRPLIKKLMDRKIEFIKGNPQSYVSLFTLIELEKGIDAPELLSIYNTFPELLKESVPGKMLGERVAKRNATAHGKPAPVFTQNDTEGNPVSLAAYKGKYVLIDFWASWCGPCRKENPNLVKAYNEYKAKGLNIIGISLDDNKDKWKAAIQKDGLPWVHISDLQGWKNAVAQQYGVNGVPANFLISPEGNIIATDLRGEALEKKLAEILP